MGKHARSKALVPATVGPKGGEIKTTFKDYQIVSWDPNDLKEVIKENVGVGGMTGSDLDTVKIPSGGSKFFELVGSDGETKAVKSLDIILLHKHDARSYWEQSFEEQGGGNPPDCYSLDGEIGVGKPGGNCVTCPLAQFDNEEGGSECPPKMIFYFVLPGDIVPRVMRVPVTSVKPMRKFFASLINLRAVYFDCVIRLSLLPSKSRDGIDYCKLAPSVVEVIGEDEKKIIRALRTGLMPMFASQQRNIVTDQPQEVMAEPDDDAPSPKDNKKKKFAPKKRGGKSQPKDDYEPDDQE